MKPKVQTYCRAHFAQRPTPWRNRLHGAYLWVGAILGLVVVLSAFDGGRMAAAQSDPNGKLGEGVLDVLRAEGKANVVIMLELPPSAAGADIALTELKSDVAGLQSDVLSGLLPSEFDLRRRYEAVPAVAGTIMSEAGLDKLVAHPSVIRIDLDVGGSGGLGTTVPLIGADQRHTLNNTGEGVVVAVLDSGLDTDHGDLADDLIREECFLDDDGAIDGMGRCPNGSDRQSGPGAAEDGAGHGTATTGIVTSRGTISPVGVAPDADIVAIKVLDDTPFAGLFFFFSEIVAALDFIINNPQLGVSVINMSLGTGALFTGDCDNSTAFNMAGATAINTLRANGVVAFASSGNNGSGTQMTSPACLSNVVSVGATDNADNVAGFTNSNAFTDIMAPGVNITSTGLANGVVMGINGTSFASPHAAGCAALLIEAMDAVLPDAIEARLETSPVQVTDPKNGLTFPRIDCGPRLDHFLLYAVDDDDDQLDLVLVLADQFESAIHKVGEVERLGNPVDKNGEGISDPNTHLVAYEIDDGGPKHEQRSLRVTNQFGELLLETDDPEWLLVPSLKSLDGPIPDDVLPDPFPVGHFKCYGVDLSKGAKFKRIEVPLQDQFLQVSKQFVVLKPAHLCNPVDKEGEGIQNEGDHLVCYRLGRVRHKSVRNVHVNNQFGPLELETEWERELCVPSTKEILGFVDDHDNDDDRR